MYKLKQKGKTKQTKIKKKKSQEKVSRIMNTNLMFWMINIL